jgi:polo-like kinase 1
MRDETTQKMANGGGPIVYVKKWMRTKHAIMFRLSNKIVQVSFQDHTEILLNSESRLVTYVNKKGER